ncbi:MAG: NAD-dependent protein deacetylase [Pseudomonadota bacterium]
MSEAARELADFFRRHSRISVVTGAGISTGSGIPDYRDRDGNWKHARPMQFAEFRDSPAGRKRYWARSFVGWQRMSGAEPNAAHRALVELEKRGHLNLLITQNVDGLHSRAGSDGVVDLHGRLDRVICMDCGWRQRRPVWQALLERSNPHWRRTVLSFKPDGDAVLEDEDSSRFSVPDCPACGGIVKPDVVFFGENVPPDRVERAYAAIVEAEALLVIGSSLMVYSGLRFPRRAAALDKPVAILNRGRTRADELAALKLDADCSDTLTAVLRLLGTPDSRALGNPETHRTSV